MMKTINVKFLYPDRYKQDKFVIVSDDTYYLLKRRSISDKSNPHTLIGEKSFVESPEEYLLKNEEYKMLMGELYKLPLQQKNRIYEVYMLGISKAEIARIEGCSESTIRKSINRGLRQLRRRLYLYYI